MQVTVGVSALIVHDNRLIIVRKEDATGVSYILPGGRQEGGETLEQALQREVWEETGQIIHVGELLWVREYIGKHHEYAETDAQVHVVDHLFRCSPQDDVRPLHPVAPDPDQVGVEWVAVDQLPGYRFFFPRTLIPTIVELARGTSKPIPVYVGDVN